MKRGGPLKRGKPLKRTPMRAKAKRRPELPAAREAVRERSGGSCEARVAPDCTGVGTEAHHVLRRSQGGKDDPSNLLWLDAACHRWAHQNVAEATALGLLRRSAA